MITQKAWAIKDKTNKEKWAAKLVDRVVLSRTQALEEMADAIQRGQARPSTISVSAVKVKQLATFSSKDWKRSRKNNEMYAATRNGQIIECGPNWFCIERKIDEMKGEMISGAYAIVPVKIVAGWR